MRASNVIEPGPRVESKPHRHPKVTAPLADAQALLEKYQATRRFSEFLCGTLAPEDHVIQTMPEASPTKWHLAHTSWFFETFVLKPHLPGYQQVHPQYAFLFNSYYNAAGKMHTRAQRGLISRPTVKATFDYRKKIDSAVAELLEGANERQLQTLTPLITLGINHEQQHQELILTDIKHVFWMNPLRPIFREYVHPTGSAPPNLRWRDFHEGIHDIGHKGPDFCFDNETPRHRVFLEPFALATRLVTNGDYLAFVEDGGYHQPEFWLSLGWATITERGWTAPLYWEKRDGVWWQMTLAGMRKLQSYEPVCALSYYEADAFARWSKARLPMEEEWEVASQDVPMKGNFAESGFFHPTPPHESLLSDELQQMFGDVWQWTQSSYSPYPGFRVPAGALGEYNGKFMCNQYVLRGASCATPASHSRRTYRNFFPPDARWQFSGIRLARSLE